nr:hypothetical protein BN993_02011 [Virgibacillus halodenitrificans]
MVFLNMNRVLAAVIAPVLLYVSFVIYGISYRFLTGIPIPQLFSLFGFMLVYIFSLPFYLIIGIPFSIIIDKINKKFRWLSYIIAGYVILILITLVQTFENGNFTIDRESMIAYPMAGFSFFITLKVIETTFKKLYIKYLWD